MRAANFSQNSSVIVMFFTASVLVIGLFYMLFGRPLTQNQDEAIAFENMVKIETTAAGNKIFRSTYSNLYFEYNPEFYLTENMREIKLTQNGELIAKIYRFDNGKQEAISDYALLTCTKARPGIQISCTDVLSQETFPTTNENPVIIRYELTQVFEDYTNEENQLTSSTLSNVFAFGDTPYIYVINDINPEFLPDVEFLINSVKFEEL